MKRSALELHDEQDGQGPSQPAQSSSETETATSEGEAPCFPRVKRLMERYNPTPKKAESKTAILSAMKSASSRGLRSRTAANGGKDLDPVEVYCRVRPLTTESSCIKILDEKSLDILPPNDPSKWQNAKILRYNFKRVFDEATAQTEVFNQVAFPLVKEVLTGKNALLFAYGVTGSGKTYTMSGDRDEPGIMPRCLDLIFNSIKTNRAMKHVFKPDRMNGFEILTRADAMIERQRENLASVTKTPSTARSTRFGATPLRTPAAAPPFPRSDVGSIPLQTDTNVYSVFITYVEIYNNYVYDLLDESMMDFSTSKKTLQTKILREDAYKNVYVNGVVECEVDTPEEAYEIYLKGQKRKKMAQTNLNTDSSRSHSIFNIRLVQAPLDSQGEEVINNKSVLTVSQLSLVDLAGSERYTRSGATGERLKEAGNINSSLMTLRKCMDMLRENQRSGVNKIVPYRDSKLTHFLKSYFEVGAHEGIALGARVKVILCINPQSADYDENIHVFMFAELTQEIQVQKPTTQPVIEQKRAEIAAATPPGRKQKNHAQIRKRGVLDLNRLERDTDSASGVSTNGEFEKLYPLQTNMVFSLVPNMLPIYKVTKSDEEDMYVNLRKALEQRIKAKQELMNVVQKKREFLRNQLLPTDRELDTMRNENNNLKYKLDGMAESKESTENVLRRIQYEKSELETLIEEKDQQVLESHEELENCKMQLRQMEARFLKEQQNLKSDLDTQLELEDARRKRQMAREKEKLDARYNDTAYALEKVREIVTGGNGPKRHSRIRPSKSRSHHESFLVATSSESDLPSVVSPKMNRSRIISAPVLQNAKTPSDTFLKTKAIFSGGANKNNRWIEHVAGQATKNSTLYQPKLKTKKSVTHLDYKDLTKSKATNYLLLTQDETSDGVVESRAFKGNISKTLGNGRQVTYTDVECIQSKSPLDVDMNRAPLGTKRSSTAALHSRSKLDENMSPRGSGEPIESGDYAQNLAELRARCQQGYGHFCQSEEKTPEIVEGRRRSKRSKQN